MQNIEKMVEKTVEDYLYDLIIEDRDGNEFINYEDFDIKDLSKSIVKSLLKYELKFNPIFTSQSKCDKCNTLLGTWKTSVGNDIQPHYLMGKKVIILDDIGQ